MTALGRVLPAAVALSVQACTAAQQVPPQATTEARPSPAVKGTMPSEVQVGDATWYGARLAGHRTASGERFDPRQMTAAHRTLPFGTWVEVTCLDTGRRVRVRITDRGPFGHRNRVIDLAYAAAAKLGIVGRGIARVELRVVSGP